ncbi:MAG: flavodoxin family protein [Gracilibacteraceae bacterium]|jgi:multimeric flavodoxin WrbA|nr:flavodoxin family protein [Gracilibacteraceae bacterium]
MKVLAICGAANKNRNTAAMLGSAFDGAMSAVGAAGEFVYLYDLNYKGCIGCHSCKLLDERKFARCAVRDGLTPVLEKAIAADVLLIGSPIYFSDITGETRSFLERYLFPGITYNKDHSPTYPTRTKVGWVFTMNAPGEFYKDFFNGLVTMTSRIIGDSEYVTAYQTQQFEDYSKYAATMFDVPMVKKRHIEQFPKDCEAAFNMGKRLAENVKQMINGTTNSTGSARSF